MFKVRAVLALLVLATPALAADSALVERMVKPSAIDPLVKQFDDANIIVTPKHAAADAPLVIFMPGTNGKPRGVIDLLRDVARQGYRVIGLEYDDDPAVVQVCPRDADPDCSAKFREMRISGSGPGVAGVHNPVAESVAARIVAVVKALVTAEPNAGWAGYLDGSQPRWDRIVVSGQSQGAGMAAYIAQQHVVRRVVLFSSPWDFTLPGRKLARWIGQPSATPAVRWFAEYHKRELTADLLAQSYKVLRIPPDHVIVFDRDLPVGMGANSPNPYHGSTVRDTGYAPQWRALYGQPSDPVGG